MFFICLFFHFDFKSAVKYTAIFSMFLHFLWKPFLPGHTPVPPRSGTWILDLSHDPIWAIWLAEVRKFHQHHDRLPTNLYLFYFTFRFSIWNKRFVTLFIDISFNGVNSAQNSCKIRCCNGRRAWSMLSNIGPAFYRVQMTPIYVCINFSYR